jgi:hypothetical protein
MRDLTTLDGYRLKTPEVLLHYGNWGDHETGVFRVPMIRIARSTALVVASANKHWEHISVTIESDRRCPTWIEMDFIKQLFFFPEETVMQLHVKASDHINIHDFCLHLWRPRDVPIPMPPGWMV